MRSSRFLGQEPQAKLTGQPGVHSSAEIRSFRAVDIYSHRVSFKFDLVAQSERLLFEEGAWEQARFHLLEFQPAKRVMLVGDPPTRIRVLSYGDPCDIVPGLLATVERLAGTALRVEMH